MKLGIGLRLLGWLEGYLTILKALESVANIINYSKPQEKTSLKWFPGQELLSWCWIILYLWEPFSYISWKDPRPNSSEDWWTDPWMSPILGCKYGVVWRKLFCRGEYSPPAVYHHILLLHFKTTYQYQKGVKNKAMIQKRSQYVRFTEILSQIYKV